MKKTLIIFVFFILFFSGCYKDDEYILKSDIVSSSGYIKASFIGKSHDGYNVNKTIKYSSLPDNEFIFNSIFDDIGTTKSVNITRFNGFSIDENIGLSFTFDTINFSVSVGVLNVNFQDKIDNNTILNYSESIATYFTNSDLKINVTTYNPKNRKIIGTFSGSFQNENNSEPMIFSGSFSTLLDKLHYHTGY